MQQNLSCEQLRAYETVLAGHNVAILGQAGTGKSYLIEVVREGLKLSGKNVAVTASTGIAAKRVGGVTLHKWAGMMDGRYGNDELLSRLDEETKTRLQLTDVLIIDEISMISMKTFDQLEFLCRHVRSELLLFGHIQLVCVGDFYQLKPVPNTNYEDTGAYAFVSDKWKQYMQHNIILTQVHRQTNHSLINAVNELERGETSHQTDSLLISLSRPLPQGSNPTKLYSNNFDVDWENGVQLNKMVGEIVTYKAIDSGDIKKLSKTPVKKNLALKKGCPVMLLRNLSNVLVNGSLGTVCELHEDGPIVQFPDVGPVKIDRFSVTHYSPHLRKVIAERHQYPICLAFAMTIHKSQGLTLPCVEVNCRKLFQAGQLGVAVGRAVSLDRLRVVDYTSSSCKPHSAEIYAFMDSPVFNNPVTDLSCCYKQNEIVDIPTTVLSIGSQSDTDFGDSGDDTELLGALETLAPDVAADSAPPSDVPGDHGNPEPGMTADQIQQLMGSLMFTEPVTNEQREYNETVTSLMQRPVQLAKFLDLQLKILKQYMTKQKEASATSTTQFYANYHCHICSPEFQASCMTLFEDQAVHQLVVGGMMTAVRKFVVLQPHPQDDNPAQETLSPTPQIQPSAYGKIRYVGGRSVAKIKFKTKTLVRNYIDSHGVIPQTNDYLKVQLLESLTVDQTEILEHTDFPTSTKETFRRQNLSSGLTNISDPVFKFFLKLEQERIPLYQRKMLLQHRSDLLNEIHKTILSDPELTSLWENLFLVETYVSDSQSQGEITTAIQELFTEITESYLRVTDAEFRRKLLSEIGKKKQMEHRKKVLTRCQANTPGTLKMVDIVGDDTTDKISSHLRLKGLALKDPSQLSVFAKNELMRLCKAYAVECFASWKKDKMIMKLSQAVQSSDKMLHVEGLSHDLKQNTDSDKTTKCISSKTGKRKIVTGKVTAKRKQKNAAKVVVVLCPGCGEGETEDGEIWINCTNCGDWWHRTCTGIMDEKQWEEVCGEADWFCSRCSGSR